MKLWQAVILLLAALAIGLPASAAASGYPLLAQRFACRDRLLAQKQFRWVTIRIGSGGYMGYSYGVDVTELGLWLRLSGLWTFGFLFPPVLLPWRDLREVASSRIRIESLAVDVEFVGAIGRDIVDSCRERIGSDRR